MHYKIINQKKLLATIILDVMGRVLFFIPRLFRRQLPVNKDKIQSILVIRTAYIGDVVMTLPLLKPLKERFPDAKVTFLTSRSASPVLAYNPYVDDVIEYDAFWFYRAGIKRWIQLLKIVRRRRFDLVVEARGDIRDLGFIVFFCRARYKLGYSIGGGSYFLSHVVPYPGLIHKVDYHLGLARYLGCPDTEPQESRPLIFLTDSEREAGRMLLADRGIKGPFIAAHPGSRLMLKRWPVERCARLYDRLAETFQIPVVLLGAKGEVPLVKEIQHRMRQRAVSMAGQTDLRMMLAVTKRAGMFICNDSAPMHLAAAVNTPTLAIFGPSKSVETGPYKVRSRVVERRMPCRKTCDESHCLYDRFHACMLDITVDEVFEAARELFRDAPFSENS